MEPLHMVNWFVPSNGENLVFVGFVLLRAYHNVSLFSHISPTNMLLFPILTNVPIQLAF